MVISHDIKWLPNRHWCHSSSTVTTIRYLLTAFATFEEFGQLAHVVHFLLNYLLQGFWITKLKHTYICISHIINNDKNIFIWVCICVCVRERGGERERNRQADRFWLYPMMGRNFYGCKVGGWLGVVVMLQEQLHQNLRHWLSIIIMIPNFLLISDFALCSFLFAKELYFMHVC